MLDDLKYIHERDAQDALGIAAKQAEQLEHKFTIEGPSVADFDVQNIVLAGMGGSALAGLLGTTWPGYKVPFEICRSYDIPAYVGPKTLFIASSYSGNTEETLAALTAAAGAGAQIVIVSSGGKLAEIAGSRPYPFLQLPGDMQPRHAVLFGYKALLTLLSQIPGLAVNQLDALEETSIPPLAASLRKVTDKYLPTVPTAQNPAKKLAQELMGKSIVIYGGPKMYPAAYKWKINFNENAKNVAWCNQFSEFNHNEFMGWTSHPTDKPYAIVELQSNLEHAQIQKRFTVSNRLLSGRWPDPEIVQAQGDSVAEELLTTVILGDFVSLYVALLNGINPTPVDLIEKLKTELVK